MKQEEKAPAFVNYPSPAPIKRDYEDIIAHAARFFHTPEGEKITAAFQARKAGVKFTRVKKEVIAPVKKVLTPCDRLTRLKMARAKRKGRAPMINYLNGLLTLKDGLPRPLFTEFGYEGAL